MGSPTLLSGDITEQFRASNHGIETETPDAGPTELSFEEWSVLVPEPQLGRLDLNLFGYQRELYSEEVARAREVVVMKSTQVGVSANTWRWAAHRCDLYGETVIYIFPTEKHMHDFGDDRIEPSIEASDYLLGRIEPESVRHKSLKQIGRGSLYLRGSRSSQVRQDGQRKRAAAAQSVSAQALVFDEYDELEPRNVAQYERRISGAKQIGRQPRVRRVGVPSIPGYGIEALYQRSDRREWHVTCEECGEGQTLTWEDNVRWTMPGSDAELRPGHDSYEDPDAIGEVWRACRECDAELDVRKGEWIALNPGAPSVGFHLTRLIVPSADLQQLVRDSRKTGEFDIEAFWNNDLGLAYSPSEASLTDADLNAAKSHGLRPEEVPSAYYGENVVTAGLDVASERDLNLRISEQLPDGRRRALHISAPKTFKEVAEHIENFRVHMMVVDANPEGRMARTLAATFSGRVVLCEYDWRNESPPINISKLVTLNKVRVNRTEAIDAMMDSIRQQRNLPLFAPPRGYFDQMKSPKRRTIEDAKGQPNRVYVKTGADDYAHAEVYDLVATELWRMRVNVAAGQGSAEEQVPDEQIGFKRHRLDEESMDYTPGLGDGYDAGFDEDVRY